MLYRWESAKSKGRVSVTSLSTLQFLSFPFFLLPFSRISFVPVSKRRATDRPALLAFRSLQSLQDVARFLSFSPYLLRETEYVYEYEIQHLLYFRLCKFA